MGSKFPSHGLNPYPQQSVFFSHPQQWKHRVLVIGLPGNSLHSLFSESQTFFSLECPSCRTCFLPQAPATTLELNFACWNSQGFWFMISLIPYLWNERGSFETDNLYISWAALICEALSSKALLPVHPCQVWVCFFFGSDLISCPWPDLTFHWLTATLLPLPDSPFFSFPSGILDK